MELQTQHQVFRTKIDSSGRIRLPVDLREIAQLNLGEDLIIIRDGNSIQLKTYDLAVQELQEYFCRLAPPETLMSEELILERREEFAREIQAEKPRG